jgi:DNA-binding CsgD family transcriptional regulator
MAGGARKTLRFRPENIGDFLEAAYTLETNDQTWLCNVMEKARAVWGRGGPAHGAIYDATGGATFRVQIAHFIDFSDAGIDCVMRGLSLFTPSLVIRTFRCLLASGSRQVSLPQMLPMYEEMGTLGYPDSMSINGLDPAGLGTFLALWARDLVEPPRAELAFYRRMAHHLGAAHRCRRRLRESQAHRSSVDATDGAEAILDARKRIIHAVGPAKEKDARRKLVETATVRELARGSKVQPDEMIRRWPPLTRARWTLVDRFERDGRRYIVARENQSQPQGLMSLSDRERQTVAYLAIGQSTKETAYALGISDATVRVLLARAAWKLGVSSRAALLDHAEVRLLRPEARANGGATQVPLPPHAAREVEESKASRRRPG